MPRRTFTYDPNLGWNSANFIATMGAYVLGVGMFIYFAVLAYTYFKGEKVGRDYWDGRTLEWSIENPPPEFNFPVIPTVHSRDAWWYEKHNKAETEKERAQHAKDEEAHGGIHMPYGSIWPFVASLGLLVLAIGLMRLVEQGLLEQPVLYLSRAIIRRRAEYYKLLNAVTRGGAWEAWLLYMLDAVHDTATWTTGKIDRKSTRLNSSHT